MIQTEIEQRVGIDPTCVNTWRSWRDGEELDLVTILRERRWPEPERALERALLAAARPGATVAGLLGSLAGAGPSQRLPPGFASRWIHRLQAADVGAFVGHSEVGWGLRQPVEHLVAFIDTLDSGDPPPWPAIDAEQEAFTLEVLRRSIFLRNAPLLPGTLGLTVLTLGGAVVLGWADASPTAYGEGLSAWARCIEFRALWLRILPDPSLATRLLRGE